jgi:predicted nucleic acid-binding protein
MSDLAIFDTSVIVDQIRTDRHLERIASLECVVRNSSVVLGELWRGASSSTDRRFVRALEKNHPVLTPTASHWIESGHLLAEIHEDKGLEPGKLRDLHFDVLIALTARANGARVITTNRKDFEMIREYRDFKLEVW